jgi:hypothetical protein
VLAEGRRIQVGRDFDAETLARLIRTLEEILIGVWAWTGDQDLRRSWSDRHAKGFDGLYGMVRDRLGVEVRSGHLFLFANSRRNRLKILLGWKWFMGLCQMACSSDGLNSITAAASND